MIVLALMLVTIFCTLLGAGCYITGHRDGYIDGRLDEKWRLKDERRNNECNTISRNFEHESTYT